MEKLTKSVIPPNVREQSDIDIQKWIEEDELYSETHSFPSVMEKVRNQTCVTFVGVPGSGKSAMAHHIALKLQEEGYEVVPTKDVRKMEDYDDPRKPQVFVIDDVLGVFGLQKTELNVLISYEMRITQPWMVKSKTLMTCREAVFNETLPYKSFLTKEEAVIKLHSSDHALDDNDKKHILQKYGLNVDLMSPALLKSTSRMFPLLCKLFSKETKFQALGDKFFLNPVECIIHELSDMQRHNKLNYATLVLCMLNENCLSKDILKDRKNEHFMNMKSGSLENCQIEIQTDAFKFVKALSAMEGTYTKQSGAHYTFIHDFLYEICANHYGKQFPDQMLLYMSSSCIANYVKPQTSEQVIAHKEKEKQSDSQSSKGDKSGNDSDRKKGSDDKNNEREESFDLCIRLREDQYPLLAERLYRDIQNMELYDVFSNPVLKHPQVCQAFIRVLETKSFIELKSLFLSSHGEVDKIVSKVKCMVKYEREIQMLLEQRIIKKMKGKKVLMKCTYNVRVISWVIYYGHSQIMEYIVQQAEQHNEVSELFEIGGNFPHQSKSGIYTCTEQESENNSLIEQCRLLLLSCYSGDVQTVRFLFPVCKRAINGVHQISEGVCWCDYTPLTVACEGGHIRIVRELVKAGAGVNQPYMWGNTPLITACLRGHVSVVEELVKVGADVNLQGDATPLIFACKGRHVGLVKEMVKAGANVNLKGREGNTPLIAACMGGHVSIVNEMVKAGADVNLPDNKWNTPLIAACMEGHVSVVEELVKVGADVNLLNDFGKTPLIGACEGGKVSVVEELVKAGADVSLQDNEGNTPLRAACEGGHLGVLEELVKAGVDIAQNDSRKTSLVAACKGGRVSIVVELIKAGADVNLYDESLNSPLKAACEGGHVSVVEELIKAGADINLMDDFGFTPLLVACYGGQVHVVEELVKAGADINLNEPLIAACENGHVRVVEELVKAGADLQNDNSNKLLIAACKEGLLSIVEELVKGGTDVNLHDNNWNTPLIAACEEGHVSLVEKLAKAGADVNLQNDWGHTPLIAACEEGHVSVVVELVKVGANVNLQEDEGNTPLIVACKKGLVSIVEELVKAGADANLHDNNWNTPLIAACEEGHSSVVEELAKAGADVNLQNEWGNTPLIAACKRGHANVVEGLVKAGTDINLQDYNWNTPLMAACKEEHLSVVEELVKAGADINLQDRWGNTPLVAACEGGYVSVVEKLVKAGADINLQDDDENTPLMAACEAGHVGIVEELVKAGADGNIQNNDGNTPLIAVVRKCSLSTVKFLMEHVADRVTQVGDIQVSPVYTALILNKPDIVKYLIQEQNRIKPGKFTGNVHLFNCLVDIRHAGVKTDSRDDVVVTDRSVWCMGRDGDLWRTVSEGDCDVLKHLLCLGLDVNQSIQMYNKSDVKPLLYTLIDDESWLDVKHKAMKVMILLRAGADVNVRVSYRECDSISDREVLFVLERAKRLVCEYSYSEESVIEYKEVMCEIKKHVRRHSV